MKTTNGLLAPRKNVIEPKFKGYDASWNKGATLYAFDIDNGHEIIKNNYTTPQGALIDFKIACMNIRNGIYGKGRFLVCVMNFRNAIDFEHNGRAIVVCD